MSKILCIDDDIDIIDSLKTTLESKGFIVESANDSNSGLKKAKEINPDLIILDVMMEDNTSGFHAAYNFRNDEQLKYKPILMLTSINEKTGSNFNVEKDGEFLPVDEFIEKPISPSKLIELVNKLLALPKEKINISGKKNII